MSGSAAVYEYLARSMPTDDLGFMILVGMCGWALYILKGVFDQPLFLIVAAPFLFVGSLAANSLLKDFQLEPVNDKVINLAFGTGVGLVAASAMLIVLVWSYYTVATK